MDEPDLTSELEFAHGLADVAARVTVPSFGGRHDVELKADRTPVTEIDRSTERAIRARIADTFPADQVVG